MVKDCFSPKIQNKIRIFTLATAVQHYIGGSSKAIRQEKEMKRPHFEKREVKLSMTISYTENTNESTKKVIELINKFIKVQDQYAKINCISIH